MPFAPSTFGARTGPSENERARGTSASRGYDRRWQRARSAFLRAHPVCECEDLECCVPATQVDHRVPHRGDESLFWDRSNWQAMSASCHAAKTRREGPRPIR